MTSIWSVISIVIISKVIISKVVISKVVICKVVFSKGIISIVTISIVIVSFTLRGCTLDRWWQGWFWMASWQNGTALIYNPPVCLYDETFYGSMTFRQLGISSAWHFISLTFHQLDISSAWHFVSLTFHQLDVSSAWHFVSLAFRLPILEEDCLPDLAWLSFQMWLSLVSASLALILPPCLALFH